MSEFARELTELIQSLAKDAGDDLDGLVSPQWDQVRELGLVGIGIAEDAGGSGGSLGDLMVVIRELARAGIGTPIVEASTAAYATGAGPSDSFGTIVVDDDLVVTNAAITASFARVPFVDMAGLLVIVTASSTVTVALTQSGVSADPASDIAGLSSGSVRLDHATLAPVSGGPAAAKVRDRLALARSSALLGSARGAYELTRRYVTQREQFGAPLIKIPAVSTALAQMAVRIGFAQSALDRAISACADPDTPAARRSGAVAAARIATADTATLVARSAHQLHGAVGVTREYGLHRYTSKLWAWRDADESQRAYCARLGARVRAEGETSLWEQISA